MSVIFLNTGFSKPNFEVLFNFGELLDAADAGLEPIEPQRYRSVLDDARNFISGYWGHPGLAQECERAAALADLYTVVGYEKSIADRIRRLQDRTAMYS